MTKKRLLSLISVCYCVINLALILMFHIPQNVIGESSAAYDYFRYFFTEACEMLMPTVGAAVLFSLFCERGASGLLLPTLAFSLPRIIYLLPYYYLYATYSGNDWQESLGISLLITVLGLAINFGSTYGFSMLMRLVATRALLSELCDTLPKAKRHDRDCRREMLSRAVSELPARISERGLLDLSAPATLAVFISSALAFIYSLCYEIYEIVAFLMEYGSFRESELIYTVAKLIFVFCMLFVMHICCYFTKNLFGKFKAESN